MITERTTYRLVCNGCNVRQQYEYDDPRDAVADACRAGWECAGREEFCPTCREAMADSDRPHVVAAAVEVVCCGG